MSVFLWKFIKKYEQFHIHNEVHLQQWFFSTANENERSINIYIQHNIFYAQLSQTQKKSHCMEAMWNIGPVVKSQNILYALMYKCELW